MGTYLKYITHLGSLTAILLSALALLSWIPDFLRPDRDILTILTTMILVVLNGVAAMMMFYRTNITRYREPLTIVLYIWFSSAFPAIHSDWKLQLALLLITPIIYLLQQTRQNPQAQELAFVSTLLLLLASMLMPPLVWLVPVIWISLIYQQALTLRSFLATLIAICLVAVYGAVCYWYFPALSILSWGSDHFVSVADIAWWEQLTLAALVIMASGQIVWRIHKENNHTRFVVILSILILASGILLRFVSDWGTMVWPLLVYIATLLLSVYFWQRDSIFRGVVFLLTLLFCILAWFF